jgi:hypothetical protein
MRIAETRVKDFKSTMMMELMNQSEQWRTVTQATLRTQGHSLGERPGLAPSLMVSPKIQASVSTCGMRGMSPLAGVSTYWLELFAS